MRTRLLTFALVFLALAGAATAQESSASTEPPRTDCLGNPDAPIVLEVFSDFQCPACRQNYLGTLRPLLAEYVTAGSVCLVYREFPLQIHDHARQASLYAVAAGRLGQWLPVVEALYLRQEDWSKDGDLEAVLARELPDRLMNQLRRAVKDPKLAAAVDRDVERGRRLGVRSTPTAFLTANGQTQRINGVVQYAILKRYLDHLLGK